MDVTKIETIEDAINFFNEEIAGEFVSLNGVPCITKPIEL